MWTRKSYPRHIDCRMLSSRPCPPLATNRQAFPSCASAGRLGAPSAPAAVEQSSASPGRLQPDIAEVPDGVSSDIRVQRLGARSAQVMVFVAHGQPSMWHVEPGCSQHVVWRGSPGPLQRAMGRYSAHCGHAGRRVPCPGTLTGSAMGLAQAGAGRVIGGDIGHCCHTGDQVVEFQAGTRCSTQRRTELVNVCTGGGPDAHAAGDPGSASAGR